MLIGYIIDYVHICFQIFKTYKHKFYVKTKSAPEPGSQRHFLEEKHILDTMVALMCAYNWIGDSS
jgi:hypothetical protein